MSVGAQRVKFSEFRFERFPNSRCRAEVVLQSPAGREFTGVAEGVGEGPAELRAVARATVDALEGAINAPGVFEVLGIKAIKAFDTLVLLVAMSARREDETQRLVGSYLAAEEPERGAALAVLNATNRYLGNTIFSR